MRVYLTGFMASGKSALGHALAEEIGFKFLDLDASIVEEAERSIPAIFREDGEAAFRTLEEQALRRTSAVQDCVVAVGGGTLVHRENMDWALEHGVVVFLDLSVQEIVRRLRRSRTRRPLFDAMRRSPGELERHVSDLLEVRKPAYERAHITFRPARATVTKNARTLALRLEPHLRRGDTDPPD